ncbi:selenium donor protein [Rubidibacter lacunae KORDI 51-2]|uniref:Selenium donor protein n=1 Tax=Rubidibacter lacunae KORDI 51-2 TaxID=582515 RepID=U5DMY4_9CHRO|nr:selenide, water dikinase SelD [Rubidibacter lacunae]ERN41055.1 selenium donor protein [Rubidibacter lacunae KORDI 51-2]
MQDSSTPVASDLVLIGGGHSHAIALRMFGMQPLPGVRLTLISDVTHTPYSGMLPGYVAGFYGYDEAHIDLRRLAEFAGAQFYRTRAIGLDLEAQRILCDRRPPVAFDWLSVDIGSTPVAAAVPGAAEHAIPIKPVPQFLGAWEQLLAEVAAQPDSLWRLAIVGGGAGGVELALNVQHRLHEVLQSAGQSQDRLELHLFHRGKVLLKEHSRWVGDRLQRILTARGAHIHLNEDVREIFPDKVVCASGLTADCDRAFWVTQASAPAWVAASGLATDARGFVLVGDTLQSVSHPRVFAAGDIATMRDRPRPKAGVFAVRQGRPLFENLRRCLQVRPARPFVPQRRYLSLIGTGDRSAIASWAGLGWHARWLWVWKDRIDRRFMEQFEHLPAMTASSAPGLASVPANADLRHMYCAGCGSKVGSRTLGRVLQRLEAVDRPDIAIGLEAPDDAAIARIPTGYAIAHTVDYFRSLVSDPFVFGQIAANHCLSDLFAMGAAPQSALAIATVPHGTPAKTEEVLYQLLAGSLEVLSDCNAALVGGHSTEGSELAFGLACNGLVPEDAVLRKGGLQAGQVLISTKAIGTGALFAAHLQRLTRGRWIDEAIASMLMSNRVAADCFRAHGAAALTDVTGFGLLGHLHEMLRGSATNAAVGAEIDLDCVSFLPGAIAAVRSGATSSLHPQNAEVARFARCTDAVRQLPQFQLLFDPQTAGGLLGAVPGDRVSDCLDALQAAGYDSARAIGRVVRADNPTRPIAIDSTI